MQVIRWMRNRWWILFSFVIHPVEVGLAGLVEEFERVVGPHATTIASKITTFARCLAYQGEHFIQDLDPDLKRWVGYTTDRYPESVFQWGLILKMYAHQISRVRIEESDYEELFGSLYEYDWPLIRICFKDSSLLWFVIDEERVGFKSFMKHENHWRNSVLDLFSERIQSQQKNAWLRYRSQRFIFLPDSQEVMTCAAQEAQSTQGSPAQQESPVFRIEPLRSSFDLLASE